MERQIGDSAKKVLNCYAGVGGNRRHWQNVEVTAVELNPKIAAVYSELYPDDKVIVADAHQYLLEHFKRFDFIWTSPPCQSHSKVRQSLGVMAKKQKPLYPDMKLYQEIIFLQYNADCPWVVENVCPYYEPLIKGKVIGRHLFWSNFPLPNDNRGEVENIEHCTQRGLMKLYDIDIRKYRLDNKRQVLRNCVDPKMGAAILTRAISGTRQSNLIEVV
jgi:DNA (cytosine-5)-methyltransferase 1